VSGAGPFGLPDADFWRAPDRTRREVVARLGREGFLGAVIDAPARVPLDGRRQVPVLGCSVEPLGEAGFDREAVLTAVSLDEGRCLARPLHDPRPRATAPTEPAAPRTASPTARVYRAFAADLGERFPGLPEGPGTWVVTLLRRDRTSNRVTVELAPPRSAWVDPEVARLAAERRAAAAPPAEPVAPAPGDPLPAYGPRPGTPPPPAEPGLALAAPDRAPVAGPLVAAAGFRLPTRPGADGPVAALGFVVVGHERAGPWVVEVRAPCDAEGRGQVALDLLAAPGLAGRVLAQPLSVYALAGPHLAGPVGVALGEAPA